MLSLLHQMEINIIYLMLISCFYCDQLNSLTYSIKNIYGYRIIESFQEVTDIKGDIDNSQVTRTVAYYVQADSITLQMGYMVFSLKNTRSINLKNPDHFEFIVADFDTSIVSKLKLVKSDLDSVKIEKYTRELSNSIQLRTRYLAFGIDVWIPNEVNNKVIYFIDSKNMDYLPWKFWLP